MPAIRGNTHYPASSNPANDNTSVCQTLDQRAAHGNAQQLCNRGGQLWIGGPAEDLDLTHLG